LGFEMDRLDDETVVLRTIPNYLNSFPTADTVSSFLDFFANLKESAEKLTCDHKVIMDFFKNNYRYQSNGLNESQIKLILSSVKMEDLLSSNTLIALDQRNLKGFKNK